MKFLANENFPFESIKLLLKEGIDLKSIILESPGISDEKVIEIAISEKRTILTFDKDYGELVFKYGYRPMNGVIYFRWRSFSPNKPAIYLLDMLTNEELKFENNFTVISERNIRQRRF